jgi:hypothetical protein
MKPTAILLSAVLFLFVSCEEDTGVRYAQTNIDILNQGKIEQVRGDFHAVGTGLHVYQLDEDGFPEVETFKELSRHLSPTYVPIVNVNDPWGSPYQYESDGEHYTLTSYGVDKLKGSPNDIIFRDGVFVQAPTKLLTKTPR